MQAPKSEAFILTSKLLGKLSTKSTSAGPKPVKGLKILPNDPSIAAPFKDTSCGHDRKLQHIKGIVHRQMKILLTFTVWWTIFNTLTVVS